MEATNCENIGIKIQVRENLTDPRITKFLEEKDWNFSLDDFDAYLDTLERPLYNERARQIVEFLVNYRDGIICPDRYNSCDPIKYPFDKNDISDPIAMLSFPAGDLSMKKLRKYLVLIYNKSYAIIGDGGVEKVLRPKRVLPEYMGIISFYFLKQWKIDRDFVEQLLRDFCEYLKADYGIMYDNKTGEVLLDLFGNAEKNIYEEKWKSQKETEEYFNNLMQKALANQQSQEQEIADPQNQEQKPAIRQQEPGKQPPILCLCVQVKPNLTDPRFVEFMQNWDFDRAKLNTFLHDLWEKSHNEYAEKIIRFFCTYKDGFICPDKYGYYATMGKEFDADHIEIPVAWLSYPGVRLHLSKKRMYHGSIISDYWYTITNGCDIKNPKKVTPQYIGILTNELVKSRAQIFGQFPDYMGNILIWTMKRSKLDMERCKELLVDLCTYMDTDSGAIIDEETDQIIFNVEEILEKKPKPRNNWLSWLLNPFKKKDDLKS